MWRNLPRYTYMDKTSDGKPSHKKHLELTVMNQHEAAAVVAEYEKRVGERIARLG